ncbi:response regulator [Methylobacterium sp. ID0610]|uniref:response regulator n=1 Tax=Methylobacterium carpenticola TaxID=3344827 RepID=UPI00367BB91A
MVVEDDYFIAMDVKYILQQAGADVVGPVPDVEQALALIGAGSLDAAVLDVNLRNEEVYLIADRLREDGVPYLFATGEEQIADRSDYRTRPKLMKPILDTELVQAVGKLMPN